MVKNIRREEGSAHRRLMTRVTRLSWAVCLALALLGCASGDGQQSGDGSAPSVSQRELIAISFLSPRAWWLRIHTDGSGQIGYGSAFQDTAKLSAGTFQLADLTDRLTKACTIEGTIEQDTAVTFVVAMGRSAESLYCADRDLIAPIFDRAVEGANLGGTRLEELYGAEPPLPM